MFWRLTFSLSVTKAVNMNASDEIRVLAFDIHFICSEYGFKHNLGQNKVFVYVRLAH